MAISVLINGNSKAKQFVFAGGNPNFTANAFVAYDGKQFAANSGYGIFGKTYEPLDWCKVGANDVYSQYSGCKITVTITKPCTVSVFTYRLGMKSTGNGKQTLVSNAKVESGQTYSIQHNDYNQGIGIVVVKED